MQNNSMIKEQAEPLLEFLKDSGIWHEVVVCEAASSQQALRQCWPKPVALMVDFAGVRPGISHEFHRMVFFGGDIGGGFDAIHSFGDADRRSTLNHLMKVGELPNPVRGYISSSDALNIAQGLKP